MAATGRESKRVLTSNNNCILKGTKIKIKYAQLNEATNTHMLIEPMCDVRLYLNVQLT